MTTNTELAKREYRHEHARFIRLNNKLAHRVDEQDYNKKRLDTLKLINETLKNKIAARDAGVEYVDMEQKKIEEGYRELERVLLNQRDQLMIKKEALEKGNKIAVTEKAAHKGIQRELLGFGLLIN